MVQPPPRQGSFAEVVSILHHAGALQHIGELRPLGITSTEQLWTLCHEQEVWAVRLGIEPKAEVTKLVTSLPSSRKDHPVLDFSSAGSQSLALQSVISVEDRENLLRRADARVVTCGTLANRDSLWKTWCTFARAWGIAPLPVTPFVARRILATFMAGRYRTPEQYVSEARRRHTLHTGAAFTPDTEIVVRDYGRACRRGIGPARAKDDFEFQVLFQLPHFWFDPEQVDLPLAPVAMMLLNCWWMTREIEASAARASHVSLDNVNKTVTWLLPASKRDPYAVGEARTHGCGCTPLARHPACPYHLFVDYMAVLTAKFGDDCCSPPRNFPLFPSVRGATLLKKHVITAYRTVIHKAGIATTTTDGLGNVRQRFGGHICRVVGAVWLFQTLKECTWCNCSRDGALMQFFGTFGIHHYESKLNSHPGPFSPFLWINFEILPNTMERQQKKRYQVMY